MSTSNSVNNATTIATHTVQAIFTFSLKTHIKRMLWSVSVKAELWVLATWNMEEIGDYEGTWSHEEQTIWSRDRWSTSCIKGSWQLESVCVCMCVCLCVCAFMRLCIYLRLGHTFLMLLWKDHKWNHKKQRFWFEKLLT